MDLDEEKKNKRLYEYVAWSVEHFEIIAIIYKSVFETTGRDGGLVTVKMRKK